MEPLINSLNTSLPTIAEQVKEHAYEFEVGWPDGPSLDMVKARFEPKEKIVVDYEALWCYSPLTLIGVVKSETTHGQVTGDDVLEYDYPDLENRSETVTRIQNTEGVVTFTAPSEPGEYDVRMFDDDIFGAGTKGKEVQSVTFSVIPDDTSCLETPKQQYGVAELGVSDTFAGNWTKDGNTFQHGPIRLPASHELEVSWLNYDGKPGNVSLYYISDSGNGEWNQIRSLKSLETVWVAGHPDEESYWGITSSGSIEEGQSGRFTISIHSTERYDLYSGLDAGADPDDMFNITTLRLGQRLEGYLFDSLTIGNRDYVDIYRIPYVEAGTTIRAELLQVQHYPASADGGRIIEDVGGSGQISFALRQAICNSDGERIEDAVGSWMTNQNSVGEWEHTAEHTGHYYLVISRQGTYMYGYSFRVHLIPPD